jgi:predicted Zn-dependent protease
VLRRITTLFCVTLFALAPFRAASAQQGQRLNLIRDAEIENDIRTMVVPIWRAAGLDPNAVEIMIVQDNSLNAFVAGGQRIFINTGLIMRTESANQLIGVLAHESGHIAGGHLARMQEELRSLTTLQILEMILAGGAMAGAAASGGSTGRGGPTASGGGGGMGAPHSLLEFLKYNQTQESSADQAAITYLQRTKQSPKGAVEFLRILQREERMQINRSSNPYLTTHPLTPERISAFEEAAARSPYANAPDNLQYEAMHHRVVAKLMGYITPGSALQHFAEADRSVPARYARAIAWSKSNGLGSALIGIDGLIKEYPTDPYFPEARGQMLYDNGRYADAVVSYRRAVQLLPSSAVIKIDFARALLATNNPDNDREAVRNLELASQQEAGTFELWRMMAEGYSRLNNSGMTSLARAEMAVLRGQRAEAQAHADAATRQLQSGTPAWQRAQDIKAYISTRQGARR